MAEVPAKVQHKRLSRTRRLSGLLFISLLGLFEAIVPVSRAPSLYVSTPMTVSDICSRFSLLAAQVAVEMASFSAKQPAHLRGVCRTSLPLSLCTTPTHSWVADCGAPSLLVCGEWQGGGGTLDATCVGVAPIGCVGAWIQRTHG